MLTPENTPQFVMDETEIEMLQEEYAGFDAIVIMV